MTEAPLAPTAPEMAARARSDLAMGLPVVLDGADGPVLALAAEGAGAARLDALTRGGQAQLAVTLRRAETLKIRAYDGDLARIALAAGTPARDVAAIADPARDLGAPLRGPFAAVRGGDAGPARLALALLRPTGRLPAAVLAPVDAAPAGLTRVAARPGPADLRHVVSAGLPMALAPHGRLHVFRPGDGGPEHTVVEVGTVDRTAPVLARLHSACFTGDVLGSLKCDCGAQLSGALHQMAAAGGGILLYLQQEGRGIGLANKMRAYALQDQGFDTVDANHRLGFEDDERDFAPAAAMLRHLGIGAVRLLTNNPRKVEALRGHGIDVAERVPLWVGETPLNAAYLSAKAGRSGHLK